MLNIKCFVFNPVSENTFVVWDNTSLECAIIDAGCYTPNEKNELQNFITEKNLTVKYLLATHLHFDHIFGNKFVSQTYGEKLSAHRDDEFLLALFDDVVTRSGLSADPVTPIGAYLTEDDTLKIGVYDFTLLHIPGHSPGSLVYYCAQAGVAFAGDVIFSNSIGRTDLWRGDYDQLITGIQEKLFALPDSTVIYCGHGPTTTVGYEKQNNPYLM